MLDSVIRFKKIMQTYFEIDDMQALDILIAAAVSHKLARAEMLWLRVIGAPGAGKTEVLRTLLSQESYCEPIEVITPASIRLGYAKRKKAEMPLLQRINGKLAITKDFAGVLGKNKEAKIEIFSLLRGVSDGFSDSEYDNELRHVHQEARFDWIIAATPDIDNERLLDAKLGERFLDLRWGLPNDVKRMGQKALKNSNLALLDSIRQTLRLAMRDIIDEAVPIELAELPEALDLAIITTKLRSPVPRNYYTKEVERMASPEAPTRLSQYFGKLAVGLMMLGVEKKDIKPYLVRLTLDCAINLRAEIVRCWLMGITNQKEIAAHIRLNQSTISRACEDLENVGWEDSMLEELSPKPLVLAATLIPGYAPEEMLRDFKDIKEQVVVIKEGWDYYDCVCPGCGKQYKFPQWNYDAKRMTLQGSMLLTPCPACWTRGLFGIPAKGYPASEVFATPRLLKGIKSKLGRGKVQPETI